MSVTIKKNVKVDITKRILFIIEAPSAQYRENYAEVNFSYLNEKFVAFEILSLKDKWQSNLFTLEECRSLELQLKAEYQDGWLNLMFEIKRCKDLIAETKEYSCNSAESQ